MVSNFFLGNIGQENVLYDILEQKTVFLGYKNKKFKQSKNWDFLKNGLAHGFGRKIAICPTFILRQYTPETCALRFSRTKKRLSKLKQQHV